MRTLLIALLTIAATAAAARGTPPTAEALYAEGQAAYDRGDYAAAIAPWETAYEISREAGLLFNLAQARRRSGDCAGALALYRRFVVTETPAADQLRLAEDLARELETRCGESPKIVEVASSAEPSTGQQPRRRDRLPTGRGLRIAGVAGVAAGASALATGLVLGQRARKLEREVTRACLAVCDWTAWRDRDAQGRHSANAGRALGVVGVVGVVGGVALYYLGIRRGTIVVSHDPGDRKSVAWSVAW